MRWRVQSMQSRALERLRQERQRRIQAGPDGSPPPARRRSLMATNNAQKPTGPHEGDATSEAAVAA